MHLIWWLLGEPTRQHFPMEARFVSMPICKWYSYRPTQPDDHFFFCTDKMVVARHYSRLTDRWEWRGVEICFGVSGRFCGSWAELRLRTGDRKELQKADRVLEPRRLTARIYRSVTVHRCVVLNHYYQPIITSSSHSDFFLLQFFVANKIWCFIKGKKIIEHLNKQI